jgi:signal transduction histidine kinase
MRFNRPSLRTKLATTVLVAFVMMVASGVHNIWMAAQAREAAITAQRNHRLVSAYTRLTYQAVHVENEAWTTVFSGGKEISAAERRERARLSGIAEETRRAAAELGPERQRANREILESLPRVLAGFDRIPAFSRFVDESGFKTGEPQFEAQTNPIFQPHEKMRAAVEREVAIGDAAVRQTTARGAELTRQLTVSGVASMILGVLLTSVLLVLIFKRLRQGLDQLERGARAFRRGDLACRVGLEGGDELARLSYVFDSMAEELSEKQRALEAAKSGLEAAVAARTAELEAANAALAAEDGRRRRFLADVSHELRTPLTIIRGEAQVALRAADRGALDAAGGFDRILEQTQGMGRLVDDLFLIARAEAGGLSLAKHELDLRDCACRAAADFEALAAERGSHVRCEPGGPVPLVADQDRIRQMFAALIDNALRHTRPGVTVTLDAVAGDGWAEFSIEDDGPGLPEQAAELFGRFARGETRGDGSGLGLSVVRALAEAHGGSARLENRDGGGARAVVRLPATQPAAKPRVPAPAEVA